VDAEDPRDPENPDAIWMMVGPRAVVTCLTTLAFIYFGFYANFAFGCVLVLVEIGWIVFCVRWAFTSRNPAENSRRYLFWERFGRPFMGSDIGESSQVLSRGGGACE
jgi:hypothetical protein